MIRPLENHSSLPINKQIVNFLFEEIISQNFRSNDRFYTYREIAEKYKTSIITVKLAIKDLIDREMLYLKSRKGTFVKNAKVLYNPSPAVSRIITFFCPLMGGSTWLNPYYSIILTNLESRLEKEGYNLEVISLNSESGKREKYNKLLANIAQNKTSGIFLATDALEEEFISRVMETGIPAVIVDGPTCDNNLHHVTIDDVRGAKTAVEYLIKNGHRKIAYLGVSLNHRASRLRLEGYKKVLESHNIKINEKWIITKKKKIHFYTGVKSMKILLKQKELPSAIFAIDDAFAFGAMRAIKQFNLKIPDDISIIGFDDIEMASHMYPALTTMHVDREKMGMLAAKRMLDLIQGKEIEKNKIIIKPRLVKRESVKKML